MIMNIYIYIYIINMLNSNTILCNAMTYEKLWIRHVPTRWRLHQSTKDKSRIPANVVDWVKETSRCVLQLNRWIYIYIYTGDPRTCPFFPFRDVWYSFARSWKLVMATARARLKGSLMRMRGGVWKLGGVSLSCHMQEWLHSAGKPIPLWVSQCLVIPIWVWKEN